MASDDSSDSPQLVVGTWVTVMMKNSKDRISGTVTFVNTDGSFGMKDVERAGKSERFREVEGFYQFNRKDVEVLAVAVLQPPYRSSPNQAGQTSNRIDAPPSPSSSKSLEGKKEPLRLDPPSE